MGNKHSLRLDRKYSEVNGVSSFDSTSSYASNSHCSSIIHLGRPVNLKQVLPERVPGQRLRVTSNGALLHTVGTLSCRVQSPPASPSPSPSPSPAPSPSPSPSPSPAPSPSADQAENMVTPERQKCQPPKSDGRIRHTQGLSINQPISSYSSVSRNDNEIDSELDVERRGFHGAKAASCAVGICEANNNDEAESSGNRRDSRHQHQIPKSESLIGVTSGKIQNKSECLQTSVTYHKRSLKTVSENAAPIATDVVPNYIESSDSTQRKPKTFYFGMQPNLGSTITKSDSASVSDTPQTTEIGSTREVARIPSQTLNEFVYNLECSRRRQLSLSKDEIICNSLADVDCRLSENDKYDVAVDTTDDSAISMQLKPSVPRKQLGIPTFSPTAAWRDIDVEICRNTKSTHYFGSSRDDFSKSSYCGARFLDNKRLYAASDNAKANKSIDSGILPDLAQKAEKTNENVLKIHNDNYLEREDLSPIMSRGWTPAEDLNSTHSESDSVKFEDSSITADENQLGTGESLLQSPAQVFSSRIWATSSSKFSKGIEQNVRCSSQCMASVLRAFATPKHHQLDDNWVLSRSMPSFNIIDQKELSSAPLEKASSTNIQVPNNISQVNDEVFEQNDSAENQNVDDVKLDKVSPQVKLSPVKRYQRRFSYKSTVRMDQKKKFQEQKSKEVEEKEKQRIEEQLAQQRLEEEFQKKRELLRSGLKVQNIRQSFEKAKENLIHKQASSPNLRTTSNNQRETESELKGSRNVDALLKIAERADDDLKRTTEKNITPCNYNHSQNASNKISSRQRESSYLINNRQPLLENGDSGFQNKKHNQYRSPPPIKETSPLSWLQSRANYRRQVQDTSMSHPSGQHSHETVQKQSRNSPDNRREMNRKKHIRSKDQPENRMKLDIQPSSRLGAWQLPTHATHSPTSSASGVTGHSSGYGSSAGEGRCSSIDPFGQHHRHSGSRGFLYKIEDADARVSGSRSPLKMPERRHQKQQRARTAATPPLLKYGRKVARPTEMAQKRHEIRPVAHFQRSASQHELRPRQQQWAACGPGAALGVGRLPRIGSEHILCGPSTPSAPQRQPQVYVPRRPQSIDPYRASPMSQWRSPLHRYRVAP